MERGAGMGAAFAALNNNSQLPVLADRNWTPLLDAEVRGHRRHRVLAMAMPGLTVFVFVGLLAAWALVSGALELRAAFSLATDHGRWWLALGAIILIVFGIVLVPLHKDYDSFVGCALMLAGSG